MSGGTKRNYHLFQGDCFGTGTSCPADTERDERYSGTSTKSWAMLPRSLRVCRQPIWDMTGFEIDLTSLHLGITHRIPQTSTKALDTKKSTGSRVGRLRRILYEYKSRGLFPSSFAKSSQNLPQIKSKIRLKFYNYRLCE